MRYKMKINKEIANDLYERYQRIIFDDLSHEDYQKEHTAYIEDLSKYGLGFWSANELSFEILEEVLQELVAKYD